MPKLNVLLSWSLLPIASKYVRDPARPAPGPASGRVIRGDGPQPSGRVKRASNSRGSGFRSQETGSGDKRGQFLRRGFASAFRCQVAAFRGS
jgi:hypothetical protein